MARLQDQGGLMAIFVGQPGDFDADMVRIPTFREALVNVDTPDEMIVTLANNKVIHIQRAYGPVTRFLLNTGWFDL